MKRSQGIFQEMTRTTTARDLDEMVNSYLETALWSSTDENDEALDKNYSIRDIARESVARAKKDCVEFIRKAGDETIELALEESRANDPYSTLGHDFWLTRNHHGAGFWDGDYPSTGDKLTAISEKFGEAWPYVGDDGKVYID